MGLRDIGQMLPPGFRFYPSDEELVCHYLYKKIANEQVVRGTLVEIDLHTCEPWQLPDVAKLNSSEWYFFSFRDRKYATGYRTNRATICGYWKATGKDRVVIDPTSQTVVGMRKTLVFYKNRAPNGIKTGWIMHEFRLENPHLPPKEDWVLCRVFHKSRGENDTKFRPQNWHHDAAANDSSRLHHDYNNTNDHQHVCVPYTCPNTATALPCHSQLYDCHHHPQGSGQNPSTSTVLSARLGHIEGCFEGRTNDGPRELSLHDQSNNRLVEISKFDADGDYGFLFDMSFEYSSINGGAEDDDQNLDHDMRFAAGGDHGSNNSTIVV